ncbi:MAG: LPS-assembly protein LptD [Oligoflexia bacterium]|nr:LPS-assembly protein LptD [Oligoflexia bacterium]
MYLVILIFTLMTLNIHSETERSRFAADRYKRKGSENKVILDGNVRILNGKSLLNADHVELNTVTDDFTATGNISFKGEDFELSGMELQGNMSSPKGTLSKGKIVAGKDIVEGNNIQRLSRNQFKLNEGRYTSCSTEPADWRLYGNNIDMTIGEYAFLDNVIVEIFGLPLLYIPYLAVPLKTERQSGFLPPDFGFGSDGFNIHESLFVVLSRSHDMTFTMGHYSKRGLKQGFEFRSAFAEESNSNLYYFHVNDKKFEKMLVNGEPLGRSQRHGMKLDQIFRLSDETYAKTMIRFASDDDMPRDFPDEIEGNADPALENKLVVMSRTTNVAYTAEFAYYENLLSVNPLENNNAQLQKLPELRLNVAKTKISEFMVEGDVSYLNIYRSGLAYDDYNNNSVFNSDEFIRTGQRIDVFPRVSLPVTTRYIRVTPEAGLRYDFYHLPIDGNAQRSYAEAKTNVATEFSRVYQRDKTKHYRAVKHTIEPFMEHRVIPTVYQSDHPFFSNTRDDMTSPMFDSVDSIDKTHTITYGITNRMLVKYISSLASGEVIPAADLDAPDMSCPDCAGGQEAQAGSPVKNNANDFFMKGSSDEFLGTRKNTDVQNDTGTGSPGASGKTEPGPADSVEESFTVMQPLLWKIYQSYDFLDTTGQPFGYLYSNIWGNYAWFNLVLQKFYNVYTKKMGINTTMIASSGHKYVSLGYSYDKTAENRRTDQMRLGFGFDIWRFRTNTRFILNNEVRGTLLDKMRDKFFSIAYNPPSSCWTILLSARDPYDKDGFDIKITFNLLISGQAVGFGKESGFWNKF